MTRTDGSDTVCGETRVTQVAVAPLQTPGSDPAGHRATVLLEELLQVARRNMQMRSERRRGQCRIGQLRFDETLRLDQECGSRRVVGSRVVESGAGKSRTAFSSIGVVGNVPSAALRRKLNRNGDTSAPTP